MDEQPFIFTPDVNYPEWMNWTMRDQSSFNASLGTMMVRQNSNYDGDNHALVRMTPKALHANFGGVMHGGAMLGFIDVALFGALHILHDDRAAFSVTVDLQTQFTGAVQIEQIIEAKIYITKETRSLYFMRGTVDQNDQSVAAFTALVKKIPNYQKQTS